ncbi:MAG: hypothetical protein JWM12_3120 [Ilumatobacteraceae bacterium]|jgi:hypothetical protein|nr:hypothetical protein [Ilumatobacteraceae bacterium]
MGFEVQVVVTMSTPPSNALIAALDHQFEAVDHAAGTKVVTVTERVSVASESDAEAFVRGLVLDAVPPGSKISEVSSTPD